MAADHLKGEGAKGEPVATSGGLACLGELEGEVPRVPTMRVVLGLAL